MPLLAGVDLGSTSIKAVLFDSSAGRVLASTSRSTPLSHPTPTTPSGVAQWSEHDPEALWQAVCACLYEVCHGQAVVGVSVASMAEAGLALDAAGQPLDAIIAWFDRRSEPQAAWIEAQIAPDELFRLTGQRVSPSFGITKLLWLREHRPHVFQRMQTWLPVPSYILYRLTGERAVDYSIASRSLLFDQNRLDWSPELLSLTGISAGQLPAVFAGSAACGQVSAIAAAQTGLQPGTICAAGGHDHLCASFAAGACQVGAVVDSTGTAQAVVQVLPAFLPDPRLAERGYACYTHVVDGQVILKAGLKAAGGAVDWLARRLSSPGTEPEFADLESAARAGVGRRAGPLWLPHLLESGSPQSDRRSRAALVGARLDHDSGDIFRAMLESLAFWLRQNLDEMQALTGQPVGDVSLIGGITRLNLLSELKADVLNRPVHVPDIPEAAAVGAALLAGLACGVYETPAEALQSLRYGSRQFLPDAGRAGWYDRLYQEAYLPLYGTLKDIHHRLAMFQ